MVTIRQKTTVKLRAKGDCPSHSLANVAVRDVVTQIDEPTERGGTNLGPAPTETALAALIGCTNTIGHKCANSLDLDIGNLTIDAVCDFDRRGVTLQEEIDVPFEKITLKIITGKHIAESDLNNLAAEVAKYCPLSKMFKQAGTIVEEKWTSPPTN